MECNVIISGLGITSDDCIMVVEGERCGEEPKNVTWVGMELDMATVGKNVFLALDTGGMELDMKSGRERFCPEKRILNVEG